jgi:hypothetical protein
VICHGKSLKLAVLALRSMDRQFLVQKPAAWSCAKVFNQSLVFSSCYPWLCIPLAKKILCARDFPGEYLHGLQNKAKYQRLSRFYGVLKGWNQSYFCRETERKLGPRDERACTRSLSFCAQKAFSTLINRTSGREQAFKNAVIQRGTPASPVNFGAKTEPG